MRVAGIMCGTSLDGIDVAVVDIRGRKVTPVAAVTRPYPKAVRAALLAVSNCPTHTRDIARLHFLLPELYADAFHALGPVAKTVELIGCHGQTIYHEGDPAPVLGRRIAATLQIGDGSVLAARAGVPVVSDFRPRDIAAGGKGAPLVPFVDYWLLRHPRRTRVALNIGGIANITVIPAGSQLVDVVAFDTGPGNMVMDQLAALHSNGRRTCDRGGACALAGTPHAATLERLLQDSFYRRRPPKTAGREQYGAEFLRHFAKLKRDDALATAAALTAITIANAVRVFPNVAELIASGGGIHNCAVMGMLAAYLPGVRVTTSAEYGIDPDMKEAIAFAILAHETWRRRPSNLPSATGARGPAILGKLAL